MAFFEGAQPQAKKQKVKLKNYFDETSLSDLEINLADGSSVFVHKVILCTKSTWFASAFDGRFSEGQSTKLDLLEDEAQVVRAMLKFMYDLPITTDNKDDFVLHAKLYALADKYDMPELRGVLFKDFGRLPQSSKGRNSPENFCEALRILWSTELADRSIREALAERCALAMSTLIRLKSFVSTLRSVPSMAADLMEFAFQGRGTGRECKYCSIVMLNDNFGTCPACAMDLSETADQGVWWIRPSKKLMEE